MPAYLLDVVPRRLQGEMARRHSYALLASSPFGVEARARLEATRLKSVSSEVASDVRVFASEFRAAAGWPITMNTTGPDVLGPLDVPLHAERSSPRLAAGHAGECARRVLCRLPMMRGRPRFEENGWARLTQARRESWGATERENVLMLVHVTSCLAPVGGVFLPECLCVGWGAWRRTYRTCARYECGAPLEWEAKCVTPVDGNA